MSSHDPVRAAAWPRTSRLVLAAFAVQASVSVVGWFVVDDRSRGRGVVVNSDFEEWATLSVVCSALLVALSGLAFRRWRAASAVAAGCVAAGLVGLGVFVAWAVLNSA